MLTGEFGEAAAQSVAADPSRLDVAPPVSGRPRSAAELVAAAEAALVELGRADLDEVADGVIADLTKQLSRVEQLASAQLGRVARRYETSMVWACDGSKSAAAALARDSGRSQRACRRVLSRHRALESAPGTAAAFTAGVITADQVDVLTAINTPLRASLFARDEAMLVSHAASLRHAQFVKAINYWCHLTDATLDHDGVEPAYEDRRLHLTLGLSGEIMVDGILDPVGGDIVATAIDTYTQQLREADLADPACTPRTPRQLRADALVAIAERAMAAPADAVNPKMLITVTCGEESFARLCELANGHVITPAALVPHLNRADVNAVLFDGPQRAITATHRRTFTGLLRRVIEVRDRHCQAEAGCDEPISRCDVDHIIPYAHGGATSQTNGRLACVYHNRIWQNRGSPPTTTDSRAKTVAAGALAVEATRGEATRREATRREATRREATRREATRGDAMGGEAMGGEAMGGEAIGGEAVAAEAVNANAPRGRQLEAQGTLAVKANAPPKPTA